MMNRDEQWLLKEKYNCEPGSTVFNQSPEEIHNKYSWAPSFFADCERLRTGEPLAYVIGHVPFLSATMCLDGQPLIPRVETEFWVEKAIKEIETSGLPHPRVLDLCAGSGCIGVAVKKAIPAAVVHLAEIDQKLHPTIAKNIAENKLDIATMALFGGNLFSETAPPYDFILSNPPYIARDSEHVARSVKRFEPALALYSGEDGLDIIRTIIKQARNMLADGGVLYIEHDPQQEAPIQTLAKEARLQADTHTDQYKRPRYTRFTAVQ